MSKASASKTRPWRLGFFLGWMLRGYRRCESRFHEWLNSKGINAVACQVVLWSIKLICLAAFLYVSYWLVIGAVVCWVLKGLADLNTPVVKVKNNENGWRYGHEGFGYYCGAYRIDSGAHDDNE
ncbi:DUF3742 family protein [Pseudomonas cichorii]|nr:DUF3742 family protein [Pseudomonas cichorii]MBX8554323.1 DUF3742 family protein [Pseudomonas cichorii]